MAQTDRYRGFRGNTGIKLPVRAATTAAITLSGTQTIDGVACVAGDRVLVKNQASSVNNGIYEVDTGDWSRTKDCDGASDLLEGSLVYVVEGTVSAGLVYVQTADDPEIGTDAITFAVANPQNPISVPVSTNQGGTGAQTAIAALSNLGLVQVTGEAGTANAQTGTIDALVTAYREDQLFIFTPTIANTGATTLTLTPSGGGALAAKNIFSAGAALVGGELQAGVPTLLHYDGTQLNIVGHVAPRGIPQVSKSIDYTTVIGDANKHLLHPAADNNPRTFTIDSNANVPYPIGTTLTFVNEANVLTIAITADTMTLAGSGSTGSRTLAAAGQATALKVSTTGWQISGVGLT